MTLPHTAANSDAETLKIGSLTLNSRLILGSSMYPDPQTLIDCIDASSTNMVTVGIRRVELTSDNPFSLVNLLKEKNIHLLPNTAGCFTAKEAILTAQLASESLQIKQVKLEVIGDDYSLYPDSIELLKAAQTLAKLGYEVYPYCSDDVVVCQKLIDVGCVCVMPLASPIGSGRGIQNPNNIEMIRKKISKPVIIDAGIGTASDACQAFELGVDAILLNTAIAKAGYPVMMANAMKNAAEAGRQAFQAHRIPIKDYAQPSTTNDGKIVYQMKV